MGDFIDFDELWAAEDAESPPPRIKAFGEVIELPRAMPALVYVLRVRYLESQVLTPEIAAELIAPLVGRERVDRWITDGISLVRLLRLAERIRKLYEPDEEEEGDQGEADAPAATGAPSTSSTAGGTSKVTSLPTSASTSPPPSAATA